MKKIKDKEFNNHVKAISQALENPVNFQIAQKIALNYIGNHPISENIARRLKKLFFKEGTTLKKIPLKWPQR
ncbi:MAG: hypothetical protein HQM16_18495, partial [Deltaproteobacteria bacterium]|nr:hypothetical protein [Deltaproteobacteria bacterium]